MSVTSRTNFCFYELFPSKNEFCSWAIRTRRKKHPTLLTLVLPVGVHSWFPANRSIKKANWFEMNWVYRYVIVSVNSISEICCCAEALTACWSGKIRRGIIENKKVNEVWGVMSGKHLSTGRQSRLNICSDERVILDINVIKCCMMPLLILQTFVCLLIVFFMSFFQLFVCLYVEITNGN